MIFIRPAGAVSMGVSEYVSLYSQRDSELADIAAERHALATEPTSELLELESIWVHRGLDAPLAKQVARALTAHDAVRIIARLF